MDTRPSAKLVARWRADYEADLDRRLGELKRQALDDFDSRFSTDSAASDDEAVSSDTSVDVPQESPVPHRVADPETNGTPKTAERGLTVRQMILRVLPPPGETFDSRDVRRDIVHRWPHADTKYFNSRVSQLLKDLLDNGVLEKLGKGERIQDPITYRVKEKDRETLLGP